MSELITPVDLTNRHVREFNTLAAQELTRVDWLDGQINTPGLPQDRRENLEKQKQQSEAFASVSGLLGWAVQRDDTTDALIADLNLTDNTQTREYIDGAIERSKELEAEWIEKGGFTEGWRFWRRSKPGKRFFARAKQLLRFKEEYIYTAGTVFAGVAAGILVQEQDAILQDILHYARPIAIGMLGLAAAMDGLERQPVVMRHER